MYLVDRVRDGRSFSIRRVIAVQHGKPIFTLSASFQLEQGGIDHQRQMPAVPAPETLPTFAERLAGFDELIAFMARIPQAFDIRYVDDPPWLQRGAGAAGEPAAPDLDAGRRGRCRTIRPCTSAC